jgi:VanZ family protein
MYADIASSSFRELDAVALATNIMVFLGRDTSLYYWVPAFLYAALIFLLSHQSNPPGAQTVPDYTAHFVEYALFGLTLTWGATSGFQQPLTSKIVVVLGVIIALYAISDEFHQSFVPNREASLGDVTMDVLGAAACVGMVWVTGRGKWR